MKEHNLTPLARLVSHHVAGVDPKIMGIGPVPAIKGALNKAGLKLSNISLVEVRSNSRDRDRLTDRQTDRQTTRQKNNQN